MGSLGEDQLKWLADDLKGLVADLGDHGDGIVGGEAGQRAHGQRDGKTGGGGETR